MNIGIDLSASIIISSGIAYSLKHIIPKNRPFAEHSDIYLKTTENTLNDSFPSGHTTFAFSTATTLALEHHNWYITTPAYLWATLIGIGRIHQGVHYPSDVVAGAIIGISTSWFTFYANNILRSLKNKNKSI